MRSLGEEDFFRKRARVFGGFEENGGVRTLLLFVFCPFWSLGRNKNVGGERCRNSRTIRNQTHLYVKADAAEQPPLKLASEYERHFFEKDISIKRHNKQERYRVICSVLFGFVFFFLVSLNHSLYREMGSPKCLRLRLRSACKQFEGPH